MIAVDPIGAWIALVVILVHLAAYRSGAFRAQRTELALHAAGALGVALSRSFIPFLAFAALGTWALTRFTLGARANARLRLESLASLAILAAVLLAPGLPRSTLTHGFLLALALRLGLWPFGAWIEPTLLKHQEMKLAVVLVGGAAWVGFARHMATGPLPLVGVDGGDIAAALFAISALASAMRAVRSEVPLADFARSQVATAFTGGLLFLGSRLFFGYAFSALVGIAALLVVLGSSTTKDPHAFALDSRRRTLALLLVVLSTGCPLTALFVEADLTLEGIAFPHPVFAAMLAVVHFTAASALIRFSLESLLAPPPSGRSVHRSSTAVPLLLAASLVLWGLSPRSLDPGDASSDAHGQSAHEHDDAPEVSAAR